MTAACVILAIALLCFAAWRVVRLCRRWPGMPADDLDYSDGQ